MASSIEAREYRYAMSKGDDEKSYSKNSNVQKTLVDNHVMPRLNEALQHVTLPRAGKPLVVADLGCSSSTNAIRHIAHIVNVLRARSSDPGREIQAFFNDLPSNDFNTLFRLFGSEVNGKFFAAGVPGSFYDRLFLSKTVHVLFSSFCVHFLSKLPDGVYDKASPLYNGGCLHMDGAPAAVGEAYKKQAATDLRNFLHARAAELAPGGLLFFVIRSSGYSGKGEFCHFVANDAIDAGSISMSTTWNELRSRGLLTEEQTASFKFRAYWRTMSEIKEGIDSCSSEFRVHKVEAIKGKAFAEAYHGDKGNNFDKAAFCKFACGFYKGALGDHLEGIVGNETAKTFWDTFVGVIERDCVPQLLGDTNMCVVALIRM